MAFILNSPVRATDFRSLNDISTSSCSPLRRSAAMCDAVSASSKSKSATISALGAPLASTNEAGTKEMDFAPGVLGLQNEGAYAVMDAARRLEAETGADVVHLEIGQPGFDTPKHIADAGVEAIRRGRTRYSSPAGEQSLRGVIAQWAREKRGLEYVTNEHVVVGPGAKPGLFFTTLALVRGPQDKVIFPDPGFPTYKAMVDVAGATPVPVRLDAERMHSFDMDALRSAIDDRTRIVVINSPGNPTGGVMPDEHLEELAALAKKHDFWVISDEIYSQLTYPEIEKEDANPSSAYKSVASLPGMQDRTVVVDGFSKSFCMTGWRLGWAIMPTSLAQKIELLLVHSVGCTATFVQEGGIAAIDSMLNGDGEEIVARMRSEFRKRRDIVVDGINLIPGIKCQSPKGAFYAWVDIRQVGRSSREVADFLLQDGHVAVLPGTDFGEGGEGYIRISYVSEEGVLKEGIRRIEQSLQRLMA